MSDVSEQTVQLRVAGPGSDGLLESLGAAGLVGQPEGSHAVFGAGSEPVVIAAGSGFSAQGYTIVASEGAAAEFWQRCIKQVRPWLTPNLAQGLCLPSAYDPESPCLHRTSMCENRQPPSGTTLRGCCVAGGCPNGRASL